jgi:hypothetical protein
MKLSPPGRRLLVEETGFWLFYKAKMTASCDPNATPRRRQNAECRMQKGGHRCPKPGTSQVQAR